MNALRKYGLAVITGASSGIGAIYADRFAQRGLNLLLVARREDRLQQLANDLRQKYGVNVEVLKANLTDPEELTNLEARLQSEEVAALVNNAGVGGLGPTLATTRDKMEDVLRLDVVALMRLSHAVLTGFRERNSGVLINIGSIMAMAPSPGASVYSGCKAFVMNFTRSLQLENAKTGIQIQLLMPGPVRTEFFSSQGMSESVFPDSAFLSAEQLVDAALAGLDAKEEVSMPAMSDLQIWKTLENARTAYLSANMSGQVAPRYLA